MEIAQTFGQRVRHCRTAKGISQEQLAELCELHRTYIGSVERGERNITLKNAEKIAQALGEPLVFFLEGRSMTIEAKLDIVIRQYQAAFTNKVYANDNNEHDVLMDAFGITPALKRENRQYWGRELGKCWESLVIEVCQGSPSFQPALRIGDDEPCDLRMAHYAIDTKYRVGSGDSGTLKKFKQYGSLLTQQGYEPVALFLRDDNLPAAMTAFKQGGWTVFTAKQSFEFIKKVANFDLEDYLLRRAQAFPVNR